MLMYFPEAQSCLNFETYFWRLNMKLFARLFFRNQFVRANRGRIQSGGSMNQEAGYYYFYS